MTGERTAVTERLEAVLRYAIAQPWTPEIADLTDELVAVVKAAEDLSDLHLHRELRDAVAALSVRLGSGDGFSDDPQAHLQGRGTL